jgi:hypothetical protein
MNDNKKCIYCGQSYNILLYLFPTTPLQDILCDCCQHCPDCKLLVDTHSLQNEVALADKTSEYFRTD